MPGSTNLPICATCGTQFDFTSTSIPTHPNPPSCPICTDPRQYAPPSGQAWTTLSALQATRKNTLIPSHFSQGVTAIETSPPFAIGQRCFVIETEHGNVLWDCIALLDAATLSLIRSRGGVKAIVISHPHYYTTHLDWAAALGCEVWIAAEDGEWCVRDDVEGRRRWVKEVLEEVVQGVTVAKVGGHFPGSLVLAWAGRLFIADTVVTAPSALTPNEHRRPGTTSYSFECSIPNRIPVSVNELERMWKVLRQLDFHTTHGAFSWMDVQGEEGDEKDGAKARMLKSMRIQARAVGAGEGAWILGEKVEH